jgi:ABC-type glycerol-3-phosphate transport system substrate-binding protein
MDSRLFMQRRDSRYVDQSVASIPTLDGNDISLIDGWMWVLVTEDPVRRDEARRFIDLMYNSDTMSTIASALFLMPSQESARRVMGDDDYLDFLSDLLEDAVFIGENESRSASATALQMAFEAVLRGATSGDAVQAAIGSLSSGD